MRAWRQALTRSSTTKPPAHGKSLSRLAYRWVKGLGGWTSRSIGRVGDEDAIPDVDPGDKPFDDLVTVATLAASEGTADRVVPRSDQAEVDAAAGMWAKLWETDAPYPELDFSGADKDQFK